MIDNFKLLRPAFQFKSDDDFYFLQIIKRKKEHPDMPKSVKVVHVFYITSLNKLDELEKEIKDLCTYHNARAYINLNKRSFKALAFQMLKQVTDCIISGEYQYVRKSFNTVCGRFHAEDKTDKKWIVDIDTKDECFMKHVKTVVTSCDPQGTKIHYEIPTKNGWHLITRPFNILQFQERFMIQDTENTTLVDIHKNNPTVLFTL